jgi:hypothetical protein
MTKKRREKNAKDTCDANASAVFIECLAGWGKRETNELSPTPETFDRS